MFSPLIKHTDNPPPSPKPSLLGHPAPTWNLCRSLTAQRRAACVTAVFLTLGWSCCERRALCKDTLPTGGESPSAAQEQARGRTGLLTHIRESKTSVQGKKKSFTEEIKSSMAVSRNLSSHPGTGTSGKPKPAASTGGGEQVLRCYPWVCSCCRSSKISRNSPSDLGGEQQLISRFGILTEPFPQLWQGCSSRLNRRKAAAATRGHLPCRVRCTTCSSATALHSQLLKETAPDSASSYPAQG